MSDASRIRVLIAEDEAHLGAILEEFLRGRGHHVVRVADGREALAALAAQQFDVALLDIVMPEVDGLSVLRQLREMPEPPEAVIITGNGTIDAAITALRLGAYDYMAKPYRMAEIDVLVRRAFEKRQLLRDNALLQDRLSRVARVAEVVSVEPTMQAVLAFVERVARTDEPVLLIGEPGTGKSLVAQAIHRLSARGARPFVDLDAATLGADEAERSLFGADRDGTTPARAGLLELAAGGTVYLAGVDALGARAQGRLLRLLEQRAFTRVGGGQRIDADVRLVASTTRPLLGRVEAQAFRADLSYRLTAMTVTLPPLRDRPGDIPGLAAQFCRLFGGPDAPQPTEAALAALQQYAWPGNVRELRAVLERAVLVARGPAIEAHDLPLVPVVREPGPAADVSLSLAELERRHIHDVLVEHRWHQGRAAEALGISAKTLYRKIREYGFARPRGER